MNYSYEEEYLGESHTEDHLEIGYLEIGEEDLLTPFSRAPPLCEWQSKSC